MKAPRIFALLLLTIASTPALAGTPQLPEPGVLELLAIAAVAGIAVAIRNRRNK